MTYIDYSSSTYIDYRQGYALLKNRKCEVTCPHFMERRASVANIKCVNRNLLGIYDFIWNILP
jgi:hypothetical protein